MRSRLRTVLFALLPTLLVLAAAEGITRAALRLRSGSWPAARAVIQHRDAEVVRRLYRPRPYLGIGPREGASVELYGRRARFNRLGYRSPERPRERPPGARRIVVAGGSTTFDLLSPSDELSWPWRLELGLRGEDSGGENPAIEVWNAGFPGWTSLENLISLETRDLDLEPALVVLYQGINDLQPAAADSSDTSYEQSHYPLHRAAVGFDVAAPGLLDRSVLLDRLRGAGSPRPLPRPEPRPRLPDRARQTFARNVRSFIAVARSGGAGVLLVTQPMRIREQSAEADRTYLEPWIPNLRAEDALLWLEDFNAVLREIAAREGVGLADAAREIAWQDGDFLDPMHYTREGAEKLRAYLDGSIRSTLDDPARP